MVGARKLASRNRYFLRRILRDSDFSELKTPRFRREIDFFSPLLKLRESNPTPRPAYLSPFFIPEFNPSARL